jgi:tRNA (cytidine32/guanosine34-2'-O)-methyltransferase
MPPPNRGACTTYRRAKDEGYRARSAFKLMDLDDAYGLLRGARSVVDLCAAPGSWCQVLTQRCGAGCKIVAVDVQPMLPLAGVTILRGDITSTNTLEAVTRACAGRADLIVCDGAPEVSGLHDVDEHAHDALMYAYSLVCDKCLREGGSFVAKIFRSEGALLVDRLRCRFADVAVAKPPSSRDRSGEAFVVCRGFGGGAVDARAAPFLARGDLSGYAVVSS